MAPRMRFDPDWSGRCRASQTFGTSRRARTRRLVRLYGFEVMNRIRRMLSSSFTRSSSAARSVGGVRSRPYALTVCPSSVTSRTPARASSRISARIAAGAWLRSRPRVTGTTQNVQCLSQPSMTVTKAFGAGRPGRLVTLTSGASPTSSTGRPSRRARSTSSPTRAPAGGPKAGLGRRVTVAVAAEGERRLDPELALERGAALLPPLLVLELVLGQRGRLADAVGGAELHGELGGLGTDVVPRRAERELVRDGADAPAVDVAGQRDRRDDRSRPVRGLRVDRHRQDVEVVAASASAGDHRARGPRRGDLAGRRPVALGEGQQHGVVLAAVGEPLLGLDVVQPLGGAHVPEAVSLAGLVPAPDARDDEASRAEQPPDVAEMRRRADRDDLLLEPLRQLLHLAVERLLVARVGAGLDRLRPGVEVDGLGQIRTIQPV